MIEYNRLEFGAEGQPHDVEVATDDASAEMVALEDMIRECDFNVTLPDDRADDERFHFTVPGAVVGEFAEAVFDIDNGKLADLVDDWNEAALNQAEASE